MSRLLLNKADLRQSQFIVDPDAPERRPLADGEVRLRIATFALTANNITYAAFGQAMQYWEFFPTADPAWGGVPVWGFAEVSESRAVGIAPGRRVYGYWPMAQWLVVRAGHVKPGGFSDTAPHRQPMSRFYNQYRFCDQDAGYRPEGEAVQALLQPLFTTAFLIDDFLAQAGDFEASQLLLSSASSKTAYATAFCVQRRGISGAARPRLIGLTSASNLAFTRQLGCYDEVHSYADWAATLSTTLPSVYIDFSGSADLRRQVHEHLAAAQALKHSASIGGTHWEGLGSGKGLPGPKPTLFFAPAQVGLRIAPPPQGWGPDGFAQRLGEAWLAFTRRVAEPAGPWLKVQTVHGQDAVRAAVQRMVEGHSQPQDGWMLAL
jgi:hypothetical protein